MIVIITDAPLDSRNLKRIAKRGMRGLARTGGIASNGSGDYVIALSVANQNLINSQCEIRGDSFVKFLKPNSDGSLSPISIRYTFFPYDINVCAWLKASFKASSSKAK